MMGAAVVTAETGQRCIFWFSCGEHLMKVKSDKTRLSFISEALGGSVLIFTRKD